MAAPYLIVWDLDLTLGVFDGLNYASRSIDRSVELLIRPRLREALEQLARAGFTQTILTRATPLYARLAVELMGWGDLFDRVEGTGERAKGDAEGLAECYGLTPEQRPERMIFIGDHLQWDPPRDHGVVFHFEPAAVSRSALDCAALIEALREHGAGSFAEGFNALFRSSWLQWLLLRPTIVHRRRLPGLDPLLLQRAPSSPPVIAFASEPEPALTPETCEFSPEQVIAALDALRSSASPGSGE